MANPTYTGRSHAIGYTEVQLGWVGELPPAEVTKMTEQLRAKTLTENPGFVPARGPGQAGRLEYTVDGAGVIHFTLYLGFEPREIVAEPLDTRNLNAAPVAEPGWPAPEDGITPLGYKETQFNRGT